MRLKRLYIALVAILSSLAISCSNEEIAVFSEEEIIAGNSAIARIKELAFREDDNARIATENDRLYFYCVEDREAAEEFIEAITLDDFEGEDMTYHLPADMGEVGVENSSIDGCFYGVEFDVVTLSKVKYILATEEFIEADFVIVAPRSQRPQRVAGLEN